MLQTQSIYPATLELLRKLMAFEYLNSFNLVGGTALALQIGHRISIDLDLFSISDFDEKDLKLKIEKFCIENKYEYMWDIESNMSLSGTIDGIKVDFIRYPYELIDEIVIDENIRMLSIKDIAAMKLSAIAQRGEKKDFFDFYELLKIFSINDMLNFYMNKYPHTDTTFLIRSLTYFDDADIQNDPIMIKDYSWSHVKNEIIKNTKHFIDKQL